MSDPVPPPAPGGPPDTHGRWVSNATSLINSTASFVSQASKEWFDFLIDQPVKPPFRFNASFRNEYPRVVRLVVVVVVFSAAILGGAEYFFREVAALSVVRLTMMILLAAFVATIIYLPIAYVFGVRVKTPGKKKPLSPRQVLFSLLFTFVPWLPVFTFLSVAMIPAKGTLLILVILGFWLSCIYLIFNFTKTIILITKCAWYLVVMSIVFPLACVIAFVFFR